MPVLLAHAIEDSTDIFGISGGGFEHPKQPLGTPLTQTTVKTHQSYQHITTVPLCCVSKYGNKLALILLTTVAHICKMVKTKTSKNAS